MFLRIGGLVRINFADTEHRCQIGKWRWNTAVRSLKQSHVLSSGVAASLRQGLIRMPDTLMYAQHISKAHSNSSPEHSADLHSWPCPCCCVCTADRWTASAQTTGAPLC